MSRRRLSSLSVLLLLTVSCGERTSDPPEDRHSAGQGRPTYFTCGSVSSMADAWGTGPNARSIVASYARKNETYLVKLKERTGYVWAPDGTLRLRIQFEKHDGEWIAMYIDACPP